MCLGGITLFLSFFAATAFGQPGALTPALVKMVQGCTSIGGFHENISVVCQSGRYGYIRRDGSWVVKPKYEMAFDFSEGRGAVVKNGRLGFVDSTGKEVIACVYDYDDERRMWLDVYPYAFHNGMMVVELHGDDGAIDRTGKVRIPFGRYELIFDFCQGLAFAREKDGKGVIIDTNGNLCYRFPDSLYLGNVYRNRQRCFAAMVSFYDKTTEESHYGLMDLSGRMLMPLRLGRFRYYNEDGTILVNYYNGGLYRDTIIINYVYDLVHQREVDFDTLEVKRRMEQNADVYSYSEGKCFVKKEVDGKKRVVVQDSSGRELWTLPLGVYDCQPWSEGLSVVRLKDGQHFRYGLMDGEGKLSFTAEQLREAERIAMAQSRLSWPALQLDSQTVVGLAQLLEEAYQEKSEEKKLLYYQRCAELAKSYRRTDNDTLREVEEVFKAFYRALIGELEDRSCDISVQSQIPHICFREGIDDLEEGFKKRGTDEDYESEIVTSDWWSGYRLGLHPEWAVIDLAECENFCPEMEEFPYGYHGLSVFRQIAKDFLKEMPFPAWNASEEYIKRSNFLRFRPSGGDTASCYCYNFWGNEDLRMESLFFDKGMKRAMLFYTKYTTFWDGEGGYCVMEKEGNEWKVVRKAIFFEFLGD
jgi:hypothetical protein